MRLLTFIVICFVVILSGCQSNASTVLNTSKLEKVNAEGNATEEQLKHLPISYKAPSLEEGLDALPFEIELPKKLPSELGTFLPPSIDDFEHDGKKIRVSFLAFSKNPQDEILLMVTAHNFEVEFEGIDEKVEIQDGVTGYYSGNTLDFVKDEIYYSISYNKHMDKEEHRTILIGLAKQML
ncbi:hypothetical protein [Bacillus sp. 165]|uniref:hypothetical protein n=1 Tax=Bacillus sp. 165 TaxID=1529117 RepID=UPI001ADBEE9F|nr:hypothetical protein [Bacillus sp. 165]MBO9129517.1 hypothetical protein [Bacillus sp. 165]